MSFCVGQAVDDDAEENGEVFYSVPEDSAFVIASDTGEIKTKQALDYETQQVSRLSGGNILVFMLGYNFFCYL